MNGATEQIRDYLQREFPGATIREERIADTGDVLFLVEENGLTYRAHVLHEFLSRHSAEQASRLVQEWRLADEMRRMEDLGLAVGEGGVRLESSN